MSSTNRGAERNKDDYYVTPTWLVMEFLQHYLKDYPLKEGAMILDPCAGGDEHTGMPYPFCLAMFGYNAITQDIRLDSPAALKGDYLTSPAAPYQYDLIITNPPFKHSVDIAQKAFNEGKTVALLQRLNWIGSDWRQPFWREAPLKHVYAHNKRASFTPDGQKDSVEYAHFVFEKGYVGDVKFTLII